MIFETARPFDTPRLMLELVGYLVKQKDVLARKVENEHLMTPLAPLSQELLGIVDSHGRVTVRHAVLLTQANRNTIKLHLK